MPDLSASKSRVVRASTVCIAVVAVALVQGVGVSHHLWGAECVGPDAPTLPLRDEPRTRIVVSSYLQEAKVYFTCAGEVADPRAVAEHEQVVEAWTALVRAWGTTRGGPMQPPRSQTGDPLADFFF